MRKEDVAAGIACGPDPDRHVDAIADYTGAGFTHVAVLQIGAETQPEFIEWAAAELLPRLREREPGQRATVGV